MIDKFDNFMKGLFESYENPVNIKWVDKPDELIGLFQVDKNIYQIYCKQHDNSIWTYKFMVYDKISKTFSLQLNTTNPKSKMTILGTIRNGMDYLISNKNTNAIIFSALDKSSGRKKLYTRFSEEIVEKYKYNFKTSLQGDKQVFILYKDIKIESVIDVIGKIMIDL